MIPAGNLVVQEESSYSAGTPVVAVVAGGKQAVHYTRQHTVPVAACWVVEYMVIILVVERARGRR